MCSATHLQLDIGCSSEKVVSALRDHRIWKKQRVSPDRFERELKNISARLPESYLFGSHLSRPITDRECCKNVLRTGLPQVLSANEATSSSPATGDKHCWLLQYHLMSVESLSRYMLHFPLFISLR